jgi:hypothetical protein
MRPNVAAAANVPTFMVFFLREPNNLLSDKYVAISHSAGYGATRRVRNCLAHWTHFPLKMRGSVSGSATTTVTIQTWYGS